MERYEKNKYNLNLIYRNTPYLSPGTNFKKKVDFIVRPIVTSHNLFM